MNVIKTVILTLLFLCVPLSFLSAQQTIEPDLVEILEQLNENDEDEAYGWENEIEDLYDRIREPVNLNSATKEELEQFPFLSDLQVENILAYLYINGQMKTIHELQLVEEMDRRTIRYLLPFVHVQPVKEKEPLPSLKNIFSYGGTLSQHEVVTHH